MVGSMSAQMTPPQTTPGTAHSTSTFIAACRRQPVAHTPIWVMRQAGRYLPEYRELRAKVDFESLTRKAELAAEVTIQPLRRFELDAAILFSDIMTPVQGMGVDLYFDPGPVVRNPIRTDAQIDALPELVPERDVPFVLDSIKLIRPELPRGAPLIGFAGGPFTLASYLVDGGPSKNFEVTKSLMYGQPELWADLMRRLADITVGFLQVQVAAGASAVQLFDSWAGALSKDDYRSYVLPHSKRIFDALAASSVPRINAPMAENTVNWIVVQNASKI